MGWSRRYRAKGYPVYERERLIRLLMMVERQIGQWVQPMAQRRLAELYERGSEAIPSALEDKTPMEVAATKLSTMTDYLRLADQWYRSGGAHGDQEDAHQLPGFVLEAVSALPREVVLMLGSWARDALGIGDADPREIGRLWVEDVKVTAWRLLVQHDQWPGHHTEHRESLDKTE